MSHVGPILTLISEYDNTIMIYILQYSLNIYLQNIFICDITWLNAAIFSLTIYKFEFKIL